MHYWDIKANLKLDDKRVTGKDDGFDMFYSVGVDGKIPFSV
ncbi:MAG: hypothetical protein Rpha_1985 [Candidatus Ruthia sp. Apha_13_S6]|nr:hypothetical protein [Candidatus Ruthia sp. Apha_13_S6]